jgi:hypothetical protein
VKEVTAKAMRTLTGAAKNGFQECFKELYKCWQKCVTAQQNYAERNGVYTDARLFIFVNKFSEISENSSI